MRYWLVKSDAPSVSVSQGQKAFSIFSRRPSKFAEGDKVIFFNGFPRRFAQIGTVDGIEIGSKGEVGAIETRVFVKDLSQVPGELSLETMLESLTFVKNLNRPLLHFRRAYRLVPKQDFESIVAGEPFIARTAYLEFLRALPTPLQLEFEMELATTERTRAAYRSRLGVLANFLRDRVWSIGDVLLKIRGAANELNLWGDEGPIRDHYFVDEVAEEDAKWPIGDSMNRQAERFEKFEQTASELLATQIHGSMEQSRPPNPFEILMVISQTNEDRFERIFRATE